MHSCTGSSLVPVPGEGCRWSKAKMSSNVSDASTKNSLPFVYAWKLERLFSHTLGSGRSWEYSHAFQAGGYRWKLALNLGEAKLIDGKGYLSLFLTPADDSPLPPTLVIQVIQESSVVDEKYSQYHKRKVAHEIPKSKSEECRPFLVSLETLECPPSGFLVVEIIDVIIHSERNACLSTKMQNGSLVYTWKIDGFSNYTSEPFLYEDHIWYLRLFPKGSGEDKFSISLFLNLDDADTLAPSVKLRVEPYMDCVDQINGKNRRSRGPLAFDSRTPSFGYGSLISLEDLHEPSKGFLVNDTLVIKVGHLKCDTS